MKIHLLFDREGPRIGLSDGYETAPVLDALEPLVAGLRVRQEQLRAVPLNDLLGLCDTAARSWTQPGHRLANFIRQGRLGFLPLWLRRANLEALARRSLRGCPDALDRFVPLGEKDVMMVRAQPRGVVVHWVAGNVPVLGLLSLVQAMLCKNANVVKVARNRPGILPHLLAALSEVTYTNARGETLSGRVLTDTVAVVYADRQDQAAARELSRLADVRVAWGGREAVESIINLPRRYGTEDIVFGPKLSFVIVGAERLADKDAARRTAAAIAADACAFDQQGCNSPHTVFVERGGAITPAEFARLLGEAMETESRRAPLEEVDPAAAMNALGVRTEYAMRGEAHHSRDIQWAVVYSDEDTGLAEPCYLRTLFVRPVEDVFEVAAFCSSQTQTAGLAVDDRRHALADALTSRGVERCPAVGAMRIYDAPWDGLFAMDRLVRWVSG
ncbi:MAG: acyl-CoA reductase [Planctomycetota bacterium]